MPPSLDPAREKNRRPTFPRTESQPSPEYLRFFRGLARVQRAFLLLSLNDQLCNPLIGDDVGDPVFRFVQKDEPAGRSQKNGWRFDLDPGLGEEITDLRVVNDVDSEIEEQKAGVGESDRRQEEVACGKDQARVLEEQPPERMRAGKDPAAIFQRRPALGFGEVTVQEWNGSRSRRSDPGSRQWVLSRASTRG